MNTAVTSGLDRSVHLAEEQCVVDGSGQGVWVQEIASRLVRQHPMVELIPSRTSRQG